MTPQEALNLLSQAAAATQANLQTHQALQQAVQVIASVIQAGPAEMALKLDNLVE